jgi:hypothetical protein
MYRYICIGTYAYICIQMYIYICNASRKAGCTLQSKSVCTYVHSELLAGTLMKCQRDLSGHGHPFVAEHD